MVSGEEKAWETLNGLSPGEVCRNSGATFEPISKTYTLLSFGMEILISVEDRAIQSNSPGGQIILQRLAYFSRLAILSYLVGSRDIPLSGRLIRPENLKGGHLFFRGSHLLPLDKIAGKYGNDVEGFITRGLELGGARKDYGDASVEVFPFPKIPSVLIIWKGDEEFQPRADLLFDSTCEFHLALDMLWSTAMICLLIML